MIHFYVLLEIDPKKFLQFPEILISPLPCCAWIYEWHISFSIIRFLSKVHTSSSSQLSPELFLFWREGIFTTDEFLIDHKKKKQQKFDRFTACLFVAWLWVVKCYCWSDASKHCTQICLLISFSAIIGATYRNLSIKSWSETPLLRIGTQDKIFWLSGFEKAASRLLHIRNYFTKIFNQICTLLILTLRIATETDDVYLISKVISGSTISDEKSAVWKKGQSVYSIYMRRFCIRNGDVIRHPSLGFYTLQN